MPHRLLPPIGSPPTYAPLSTSGMDSGTIRDIISRGWTMDPVHEEAIMPGVQPQVLQQSIRFVSGPSVPIDPLMIPGPTAGTTDWVGLIRDAIDKWWGGGGGVARLQEPGVGGVPQTIPIPGGLMRPEGGIVTGTGCQRTGGRAPFITMPNGLPGCPSGYHPEKQGQPYCVRNRRMNPLNPRALSRATRRVGGFARAVKRARTLKKICRTL